MIYTFVTEDKREALEMEYADQLVDIVNQTLNYLDQHSQCNVPFIYSSSYSMMNEWLHDLIKSKGFEINSKIQLKIPEDIGC